MPQISREDIRRVVVILAGSRTGSSFLFSALKSLGKFIAPTGEETPYYRLNGLGVFHGTSYSDEIQQIPTPEKLNSVFESLKRDLGVRTFNFDAERLAEDFFERLNLQWPNAMSAAERQRRTPGLIQKLRNFSNERTDWRRIFLDWIRELANEGLPVHSAPYSAGESYSHLLPLMEEPPYIHPEPRAEITKQDAAELPLLLKTSTNIYRTEFLRALFPRAEFQWIILRRNPAATVGALMDGWLSGGFHSHDLKNFTRLSIKGYSEMVPFGDRYWKFDMPPGWQDYVSTPLTEVCAFQWCSAYEAIAKFRKSLNEPTIDVSYEELISPSGKEKLRELIRFCGTAVDSDASWDSQNPVAAVSEPRAGKWRRHASDILPVIERENFCHLARQFNYDPSQMDLWP